jgi:plasmid replication initiation protein
LSVCEKAVRRRGSFGKKTGKAAQGWKNDIYAIVNEISNVVNYKKPGALDFTRTPGFS